MAVEHDQGLTKGLTVVLQAVPLRKSLHLGDEQSSVGTGHSGEEVVDNLELKTAVEPRGGRSGKT